MKVSSLYKQARARGNNASTAIGIARHHIAGPLATYDAAKKAWEAEPDKRRYAAGGSANHPKYPMLYSRCAHDDAVPDGYMLFGFLKGDSYRDGLSDSPDYGYYADSLQDATYYPCVLIRRTSERHAWACIPAYFDGMAEEYIFTDRNPRDTATSAELFDHSSWHANRKQLDGYSLARDVKGAARTALICAEQDAETAREYDEKLQEASRANDERETARDELKQARLAAANAIMALRQQRAASGYVAPMVCDLLRAKMQECRDDMRTALETIAEKTDTIAALDMADQF